MPRRRRSLGVSLPAAVLHERLIGLWRSQGDKESHEPCMKASMEFQHDGTMLVTSGKQMLTARTSVDSGPSRWSCNSTTCAQTASRNCQAFPADYVLQHYLNTFYVDVHGDTLRIYTAPEGSGAFLKAIRVR